MPAHGRFSDHGRKKKKIKENLKRVVCKNLADVASGKVVEGSVLSQILQQCNELLEGWSGVCHCKVYRIGRDTHKDRKKGQVHCWKLSDFSTCSMLFPYLLICSYILPYFFLFFLGLLFVFVFLFFVCFFFIILIIFYFPMNEGLSTS